MDVLKSPTQQLRKKHATTACCDGPLSAAAAAAAAATVLAAMVAAAVAVAVASGIPRALYLTEGAPPMLLSLGHVRVHVCVRLSLGHA